MKTAQRKVSRRKKGGMRRRKAVKLLAKAHLKVKRQRLDFQHKARLRLVRDFDVIYHDDVQVANKVKKTSISPTPLRTLAGAPSSPSFPARQHAPVGR